MDIKRQVQKHASGHAVSPSARQHSMHVWATMTDLQRLYLAKRWKRQSMKLHE